MELSEIVFSLFVFALFQVSIDRYFYLLDWYMLLRIEMDLRGESFIQENFIEQNWGVWQIPIFAVGMFSAPALICSIVVFVLNFNYIFIIMFLFFTAGSFFSSFVIEHRRRVIAIAAETLLKKGGIEAMKKWVYGLMFFTTLFSGVMSYVIYKFISF